MDLFLEVGMAVVVVKIEVVLPTYNGAAFLERQVATIANQTLMPWRLLIRDDGSTDGTLELLEQLQYQYGDWILRLSGGDHLGCTANINQLLNATTAPYVALADQDDIWLPEKLQESIALMKKLERKYGGKYPLLVHGDLRLVDCQGESLGATYLQRQRLDPSRTDSVDLSLTNVVTGCTVLLNRTLLEKALPIPSEALMHDWWLSLVACVFGVIGYLELITVEYRQHRNNVLGATGMGWSYWLQRFGRLMANPSAGGNMRSAIGQIQCFEKRYGCQISCLPTLLRMGRPHRWLAIWRLSPRHRPCKHGPMRTFGFYILLCMLPGTALIQPSVNN